MKKVIFGLVTVLGTVLMLAFQNCSSGFSAIQSQNSGATSNDNSNGISVGAQLEASADKCVPAVSTDAAHKLTVGVESLPQGSTSFHEIGQASILSAAYDGSAIFAATGMGISMSKDLGTTWVTRTIADGLGSDQVRKIVFHKSAIYVATAGGFSISQDGGKTFSNTRFSRPSSSIPISTADSVYDFDIVDEGAGSIIYATTYEGLWRSTDFGKTFSIRFATYAGATEVVAQNSNLVMISNGSSLLASLDGGLTFSKTGITSNGFYSGLQKNSDGSAIYVANGHHLYSVSPTDLSVTEIAPGSFFGPSRIIASGANLFVYDSLSLENMQSLDGGTSFVKRPDLAFITLNVANGVILGSGNGKLVISFDLGQSFSSKALNGRYWGTGTAPILVGENDVKLVTAYDGVFRSTDQGENFFRVGPQVNGPPMRNIWFASQMDSTMLMFDGAEVFVSNDGGANFSPRGKDLGVPAGTLYQFSVVDHLAKRIYLVDGNNVTITADQGATFQRLAGAGLTDPISALVAMGKDLVIVDRLGHIKISHDGGATFDVTSICSASISTLHLSNRGEEIFLVGGRKIYFSRDHGVTFETAKTDLPADVGIVKHLAINDYGIVLSSEQGFYISTDWGKTYSKIENFAGMDISQFELGGHTVYLKIQNEGVFKFLLP